MFPPFSISPFPFPPLSPPVKNENSVKLSC
jgi:hypothetical protein